MPTHNEVVFICDRIIQAAQEGKANAIRLANLDGEIKTAQATLGNLQNQVAKVREVAAEIEAIDQEIRKKRSELAELQATIAKKHEQHGSIDSDLRNIIKRASAVTAQTT